MSQELKNAGERMRTRVLTPRNMGRVALVAVGVTAAVAGGFGVDPAFAEGGTACPVWQCGFNHSEAGALRMDSATA